MKNRLILIILFLLATTLSPTVTNSQLTSNDPIILESMKLLERLQELNSKGINVTLLVNDLNKAVQLAEEGKRYEAKQLLNNIESNITNLESTANKHYYMLIIYKAVKTGLILSTPVVFYYGFPKLYLYIWFKTRKRWLLENGST